MVQVRVNLCTMHGWREERERQKEKEISSLLSPILEHVFVCMCACLSLFVNLVVHTLYQSTNHL
jgi:hypothetical protein